MSFMSFWGENQTMETIAQDATFAVRWGTFLIIRLFKNDSQLKMYASISLYYVCIGLGWIDVGMMDTHINSLTFCRSIIHICWKLINIVSFIPTIFIVRVSVVIHYPPNTLLDSQVNVWCSLTTCSWEMGKLVLQLVFS